MPKLPPKKDRPWIPKREKKTEAFKSNANRNRGEMKAFYNSKKWRSLRNYKIQLNPICEECERKGLVELFVGLVGSGKVSNKSAVKE